MKSRQLDKEKIAMLMADWAERYSFQSASLNGNVFAGCIVDILANLFVLPLLGGA